MPRGTKALTTAPWNTKNTVAKVLFVAALPILQKGLSAGEAHESCLTLLYLPTREESLFPMLPVGKYGTKFQCSAYLETISL
jgi:hypothetical protein